MQVYIRLSKQQIKLRKFKNKMSRRNKGHKDAKIVCIKWASSPLGDEKRM